MNIHEYQAKDLFKQYDIPIPMGHVVHAEDSMDDILSFHPQGPWVLKAQVHAGGRGKAGGIVVAHTPEDVLSALSSLMGKRLCTPQTTSQGQLVTAVLIEEHIEHTQEWYVSCMVDRTTPHPCISVMLSRHGGINIEQNTEITRIMVDPLIGWMPHHVHVCYEWGLSKQSIENLYSILERCLRLMKDKDITLIEINPLIEMSSGSFVCADAKIAIDDNALYRQQAIVAYDDMTQYDAQELYARKFGLNNYVVLEGSIACIVNGAGLAMATMDMIEYCQGHPANFLDIGGDAHRERVASSMRAILHNTNVKVVFIHILGGIIQCDMVAEAIVDVVKEQRITVPLVVRLVGNHAEEGMMILRDSMDNIYVTDDVLEATQRAVAVARGDIT